MRRAIRRSVFFVSILLFASAARAQSNGGYLGLGVGSSYATFNSADFSLGLPQVVESADRTSVGGKAFAGYRFKNLSGEIAYIDLGKFTYAYDGGASGSAAIDYKVTGFAASAIVACPLAMDFYVFGRLGAFASTAKTSLGGSGLAAGSSGTASRTALYYGIGIHYDFAGGISGRLEYENFGEVGDSNNTGRVKVSLTSVSLLLRF
jgi:opacity protein-like surface antigen